MLEIENACIRFGDEVLFTDLNLKVRSGELVGISGDSGKGKTSLLRAIMGFVPLEKGNIIVDHIPLSIKTVYTIRRKIAWMPQEVALPAEWVKDMIKIPFELKANQDICFSKDCLMHYFEKLGLEPELYEKRVNEISGGQKQRIMLAVSALLSRPLLLVDEPTSALDATSCEKVLRFFHQLTATGTCILAVSHDKNFIEGCNRKILIE